MPEEGQKEEKKDEKKEKKDEDKVVLQVQMHCEDCQRKVHDAVMGYPGVESIELDMKGQKLTVKGKIDAKKFFEKVKKKSGGKATKILYPELKKEDGKKEAKDEKKKDEKKPVDVTVVLKVYMHCRACAEKVHNSALAMEGVYAVQIDGDKVTIKGKDLDPKKVCEKLSKKTRKHAEIVPPKKDEKKDGKEEKKDEKKDDKKEDSKKGEDKKEASKDQSKATKVTIEYVYPPQYFSDENPNSCSVM